MSYGDQGTEAEYLQSREEADFWFSHDWPVVDVIHATSYMGHAKGMMHMTGKEMKGKPCPTCGSKLVPRRNRDGRWFVACDKTKRQRCPFSINMYETLQARSNRINRKVLNNTIY